MQAVSKPVWHIPLLCVQQKTPDDGQRNCPKHVEFYSKNKFEKLVHLVGVMVRIYHDARSPERENEQLFMYSPCRITYQLHFACASSKIHLNAPLCRSLSVSDRYIKVT